MRVLVTVPTLSELGGVETYFNAIRLNEQPEIEYFHANSPKAKTSGEKLYRFILIYAKFLASARRFELIHVNPSFNMKSFYRDLCFVLAAKFMRKKVLVFFRGWDEAFEKRVLASKSLGLLFRRGYAKADAFVVLGELFKQKIRALGVGPATPVYLETTVADCSSRQLDLQQKFVAFDEHVKFLFLARITKSKGVYIAIDAFDQCQKHLTNRRMTLYIAGSGDELGGAKEYVRRNAIQNVVFTGRVAGLPKHKLLCETHVMLLPTYHGEGMPNSILEGMLYGMAIISRVNAAIPDVVIHNENGFLTDSLDSETFCRYCKVLASDKGLYVNIAQRNHKEAMRRFTPEAVRSRILDLYAELLAKGDA